MEADASIRGYFASAQAHRRTLETSADTTSSTYQENLQAAIASLEECRRLANRISLFSLNETEDDISTTDVQYLLPILRQLKRRRLIELSDTSSLTTTLAR